MRIFIIGLFIGAFLVSILNITRGLLKYHESLENERKRLDKEKQNEL